MPVINLPILVELFPGNTQVLNVTGLKDVVTGTYLDAATVTATLKDQRGNPDPVLNNITMTYLPATNGNYQGTVPFQFSARLGDGYTLELTASQGGVQSFFSLPAKVKLRSRA